MFLNFACNNAIMKSYWLTLAFCLVAYTKKYFQVLMEAVVDQVSPTNSLFCISPLSIIFNLNLSGLPSDLMFALYTSIHGVTVSPLFGPSMRKVWFLIRFLISFRFAFSQGFFIWSDNFVTSAKFVGSGMKWETSEPDSPKGVNSCENIFYNSLKYLV